MSNIPLLGQIIIQALSIIGFGGIVGLFVGHWLARGRPRVSLIGIETGMGIYPVARSKIVEIPEAVTEQWKNFRWRTHEIDEVTTIDELFTVFLEIKRFSSKSEKTLRKIETLLKDLSKCTVDKDATLIVKQLLDNQTIHEAILFGLRSNEFTPSIISRRNPVVIHAEKTTKRSDNNIPANNVPVFSVEFPGEATRWLGYPDVWFDSDMERIAPFVEVIKHCDRKGIREALDYSRDKLGEQHEIADQIIKTLQPFVQSTYWQIEVIVANRGNRTVLLSPYAILTTKGANHPLTSQPLTVLTPIQEEAKANGDKKADFIEQENRLERPSKYLVLKPQSVQQITFLSDDEVNTKGKYSELHAVYDAGILDCSIVLKREDTHVWGRTLRSSWVAFGKGFTKKLRDEIDDLASHRTLLQKIMKK